MDVDSTKPQRAYLVEKALQWSHVLMDVDRSRCSSVLPIRAELQWSHVLMDVDRRRRADDSARTLLCFNGATS